MPAITYLPILFLVLSLLAQAQSDCEPELLTRLSDVPAYLFVPLEMADTLTWLDEAGWEVAPRTEASWHLSLLQTHLEELVAIEPRDTANPVCAAQQRQFMQRAGWVLLIPEGKIERARAAGFELIEQEGKFEAEDAPITSWGPSLGLIWGTIDEYPASLPGMFVLPDSNWHDLPPPKGYVPADSATGKLQLEEVEYGWIREK
jgi:hypothetical protein